MVKRKSTSTSASSTKSARKANGGTAKSTSATAKGNGSAAKTAASTQKKSTTTKAKSRKMQVSAEQRLHMIQEAAYFKSIGNGASDPTANWLSAEREIDSQVKLSG